ncbi:MAG: DUF309 domain-containing protein [Caldilineaceae bacterium]
MPEALRNPMHLQPARPTVVVLLPDLFLAPRLQDVIAAQGGKALLVETPEAFVDAVDGAFPVLALVDLGVAGDWAAAIQRCKMRPHTRQVPIYAFGSHVETEVLRAARNAGADHAWARSKMMEELPALVAAHVSPPVRYPEGWDEPLSATAREGIAEFNRGEYFEQHELLEHAWLEEQRPVRAMYQGILQVGVAFLQIERGNWAGAIKMFRRGLPRLRDLPPICQGVHLAEFRSTAEEIHASVTALGPERLAEFDRARFPHILVDDPLPPPQ